MTQKYEMHYAIEDKKSAISVLSNFFTILLKIGHYA